MKYADDIKILAAAKREGISTSKNNKRIRPVLGAVKNPFGQYVSVDQLDISYCFIAMF